MKVFGGNGNTEYTDKGGWALNLKRFKPLNVLNDILFQQRLSADLCVGRGRCV